jgi:hydrogenase nickel incorporation protein HypA/HybF
MHEHSIAMSIIKITEDEMTKQSIHEPVEKITFLAGVMHAVIPDSLQFHFDIARRDYPLLKNTVLEIVKIPVHVECPNCGREETLDEAVFICSECSTPVIVKSGQELRVDSIEFAD